MKTCSKCGKSKDEEKDFSKHGGKKRADRQPYCKVCQSEYQKSYYRANAAAQKARCNKRRDEEVKRNQQHLIDYLKSHPCVDCREPDIVVLQFDHVRGQKHLEIGRMISYPWRRIEEEISKCDVRCANCHTRRTALVVNNYKISMCL